MIFVEEMNMKLLLQFTLCLFISSACDNPKTSKSINSKKNVLNQTISKKLDSLKIEIPNTQYSIPLKLFGNHNLIINYVDQHENIISTRIDNYEHTDSLRDEYLIEIIAADKRLKSQGSFIDSIKGDDKRVYFLSKGNLDYELIPIDFHRPGYINSSCVLRSRRNIMEIMHYDKDEILIEAFFDDTILNKNELLPFFQVYFDNFHLLNDFRNDHSILSIENQLKSNKESLENNKNVSKKDLNKNQIEYLKSKIIRQKELLLLMKSINYEEISLPSTFLSIYYDCVNPEHRILNETIGFLDEIIMKNIMKLFYKNYSTLTAQLTLNKKLIFLRASKEFLFNFHLFTLDLKSYEPIPPPPPPPLQVKK